MAQFLLGSSPIHGQVAPVLRVAEGLGRLGHEVVVLTSSRFAESVAATGARHVPLPAACDYDDWDLERFFPERATTHGLARITFDACRVFADSIPHQHRALKELLAHFPAHAILVDSSFYGVLPLLFGAAGDRPPVVAINVTPFIPSSRDTAPFGLGLVPSTRPIGRARNRALRGAIHGILLRPAQDHFNRVLASVGSPALPVFYMDAPALADRYLQPTVPSFEYPRSDLGENVRFVGPILPPATVRFKPPRWWDELDGHRPIVHVTQGTVDNADLGRLVGPALVALEDDDDVLVVVTTGGRPASAIPGHLPCNARVAEFLPYDKLLPKVDVMVTNGGYAGVHQALAHGIPLVVAGASEDKPEVAARVAWAGVGVNLHTGDPTVEALRVAIRDVRSQPSYRDRARALRDEMVGYDAVRKVTAILEDLAGPSSRS